MIILNEEKYTAIADAIRQKTNTTEKIKPENMISSLSNISAAEPDVIYHKGYYDGECWHIEDTRNTIPSGSYVETNYGGISIITIGDKTEKIESAAIKLLSLEFIFVPSTVTTISGPAFHTDVDLVIYTDAESKPEGWAEDFNVNNYRASASTSTVIYGSSKQDFLDFIETEFGG